MKAYGQTLIALGACALVAGVAACGGSTPSSSSSSKPPVTSPATSPSASPSTSSAAASEITANWIKFFNFSTPTAQRVPLLENGSDFTAVLQAQGSNKLYSTANAKVLSVSNITPTTATVKYDILLGTTPALTNQTGTAVYQDGTWKVGDSSLCGLLTLEGVKPLPAACSSAS